MNKENGNSKKVGFVAVVGRPGTGKSTFMNQVIGEKVSIVSTVPQTTQHHIKGIYQDDASQIIFLDTPGFHVSTKKFNQALLKEIRKCLKDSNIILYLIDVSRKAGEEEREIIKNLKPHADKVVIVYNKKDLLKKDYKDPLEQDFPNQKRFFISALKNKGIDEVVKYLKDELPVDHLYYPEDYYTDQPMPLRISEIIREKVILNTKEEVPHAVYVEIDTLERHEDRNLLEIFATIYTETESQKQILVGKSGTMIKKISVESRKDLEDIFEERIFLKINVKVSKKWKTNEKIIKKILY